MGLRKREYKDKETIITADNLNDIQDAVIALEDGLFSVDNDKSGEVITITDAANRGFRSLSVFGKTTQDGTPTPDAPVDLVSVGDGGSITVNVNGDNEANSMTIATPNGLPGIPVSSGGNYTDANGQQWICDEIDLERGVIVQRLVKVVFDENSNIVRSNQEQNPTSNVRFDFQNKDVKVLIQQVERKQILLSNYGVATKSNNSGVWLNSTTEFNGRLSVDGAVASTVEEMKTLLAVKPIEFLVPLAEPVETPLSAEELAAYAALHTYKDNTTVSNDASAHIELEYVMDAKKYFESLVGSSSRLIEATVE